MGKGIIELALLGGISYLAGSTATRLAKQDGAIGLAIGVAAATAGAWIATRALK